MARSRRIRRLSAVGIGMLASVLLSAPAQGQVVRVEIGVDGMT